MKSLVIFLALFLSGCGFIDESHYEVDPNLVYYTERFFSEAADRGMNIKPSNLIVRLGNCVEEDGVIGITKFKAITTVIIDKKFFESRKTIDSLMIETVVFHELGHAIMHREHCDWVSLMNPNKYISDYRLNEGKRTLLIDELLGRSVSPH